MFGPEDDEDFTPAVNSKLASLFGQPVEEGNTSLTYTAPKQPRKTRPETASPITGSPGKLGIIIVQAVQTYKLEGGIYNNQGKLGVALLGNTTTKLYQLLLYKNKQQHVTTTKITDKFQFIVQDQNYASFYDDRGQNWSIMFESENNAIDFAREIGLARACVPSEKGEQPFYMQDLKVGKGSGAEMGDLLEIRYTALPFINGKLEKAIESNLDAERPQRVNIRKGVWEEALLGATKGCKKLIVLAPVLFGPWKPLVDVNQRLVVEVEVGRLKTRKQSRGSTPIEILNHPDSSESNVDSSTDETSIKARGASISEALTNSPKTHKASIISRMARMGQATLPLKGAVMCNPSDSEETEEESGGAAPNTSIPLKSALKSRNISAKRSVASTQETSSTPISNINTSTNTSSVISQPVSVYQPASLGWHPHSQHQQYLINGVPFNFATHPEGQLFASPHQVVPVPTVAPTPSGTPSSEPHLSLYFSENRTHNAEIRMGLSKVSDKVDQILGKLDTLQQSPVIGVLEPKTLLASIQKLVLENEQLQTELADKRLKMEQQNEKIYQLLQHKFLEQSNSSNSSDQQDASFQAVVLGLQQEKTKLATELSEAVAKINTLQIQASNFEQVSIELREEVKNLTTRLQSAYVELDLSKLSLIEQENLMRSLKEKTDVSVNLNDTQDSVINDLQVKVRDLQEAKIQLEKALLESNQQVDLAKRKLSEDILLMQNAHKEEITKLEILHKHQLNEDTKNNASCNENDCHHIHDLQKLEKEHEELKCTIAKLKNYIKSSASSSIEDLKKVMNVMFRLLKTEFQPGTNYDGSAVRQTILSSIQDVTLQYVQMKTETSDKVDSVQTISNANVEVHSSAVEQKSYGQEKVDGSVKSSDIIEKPSESNAFEVSNKKTNNNFSEKLADKNIQFEETKHNSLKEKPPKVIEPDFEIGSDVIECKETHENKEHQEEKLDEKGRDEPLGTNLQVAKPREPSVERGWRPQPPPSPLFDDEEDDDDWLS